eukprot:2759838-Prorocentrum_lima.AAC.1
MGWPEHDRPSSSSEKVPETSALPLDELPPWVAEELLWDAADWTLALNSEGPLKPVQHADVPGKPFKDTDELSMSSDDV